MHESWKLSADLETADWYVLCKRLLEAPAQNAIERKVHTITAALLFCQHYIDLCTGNTVPVDFTYTRVQISVENYKSFHIIYIFQGLPWNCVLYNKETSHSVTFFANGYTLW